MNPQLGDVSEDGFWVLTTEGWQPSEKQLMALNQGAIPHNASLPQQTVIANYSVEGKRTQSSEVMKYIFSGAIALALILLLIGMYHDSWTGVDEDGSDRGQKGGIGLTGVTYDCSDSTGTDSDGDSNKEICKFGGGIGTGEIPVSQILIAESVEELVEDLPDEMSGDLDTLCASMSELNDIIKDPEASEDIGKCEDRSTAGTTAIVFFWFSFIGALVTGIIVITSLYQTIPYSDEVEKYGILGSAIFALLGFISWLILKPESDGTSFGPAFYITIFSIVLLTALAVIQFIRPKAIGNLVLFE
jgi:hypothetical protein